MALIVPTYPNPNDKRNPLVDAYAWLAGVYLEISRGNGRIDLTVHPNEAAWADPPLGSVGVTLGQVFAPATAEAPEVRAPTLAELMAETNPIDGTGITFAQAYAAMGTRLYQVATMDPRLAGSKRA